MNFEFIGFSIANKTWLPIAPNYKEVNVKNESIFARSHLKVYKDLIALRQTKTLRNGSFNHAALNNNVLVLQRSLKGEETFVLIANIAASKQHSNLTLFSQSLPNSLKCKMINVSSKRKVGDIVQKESILLDGYESLILATIPSH